MAINWKAKFGYNRNGVKTEIGCAFEPIKGIGDLQELIDAASKYREAHGQLAEAEEIIADGSEPDLVELAEVERDELQGEVARMEEELKVLLVPKDPNDGRNAIIEIRAGAGGDEAGLFASNLYRM